MRSCAHSASKGPVVNSVRWRFDEACSVRRRVVSRSLFAHGAGPPRADDGQWVMPAKNTALTRFSHAGRRSTPANAAQLKLAFTFSTGVLRGHEAAPIVADNTMFIVTPYPEHRVRARPDQAGRADEVEVRSPSPTPSSQGVACCDVVNRGAAYADGRLFFNTLDNQTIALDAKTRQGAVARASWATSSRARRMTMAPLVVKDKVLVGNSGGEFGVRGWLTALDAATGKIAVARLQHRARQGRADRRRLQAVLCAGPRHRPRREDAGRPRRGRSAAAPCGAGSPTTRSSTSSITAPRNPGPWNPEQRPGDNKWTSGIFAREPDTGQARWFYQIEPARPARLRRRQRERADRRRRSAAQTRKVLVHPDRNGYLYVIDRATGQVLSATPFVHDHDVDRRRPADRRARATTRTRSRAPGKTVRDICPASPGGKDWQPVGLFAAHAACCTSRTRTSARTR